MIFNRYLFCFVLSLGVSSIALPSRAQDYDRPPGAMGDDGYGRGDTTGPGDASGPVGASVDTSDPAGLAVRVGRLEGRVRDMTGQIEELQNANRKLVDQLQKFQADVESRTGFGGVRQQRGEVAMPATPRPSVAAEGDTTVPKPSPRARDDAFDPDTAPNAPGQPRPIGTTPPTPSDDNAPMDLSGGKLRRSDANPDTLAPTLRLPSASPSPAPGLTPNGTVIASVNPDTPRGAFEAALGYYKNKQYDDAEKGFSAFIEKNPKNRLVADATYYLGESFAQRGRSREAAEQYLKISTDFATSTRAPDAMLHLGISLKALGAKEQACATFSEVSRKYPNAPAYIRTGAERESKRAQC